MNIGAIPTNVRFFRMVLDCTRRCLSKSDHFLFPRSSSADRLHLARAYQTHFALNKDEKVWLPWNYREVLKQAAALLRCR
jgi:hypothetical protein